MYLKLFLIKTPAIWRFNDQDELHKIHRPFNIKIIILREAPKP